MGFPLCGMYLLVKQALLLLRTECGCCAPQSSNPPLLTSSQLQLFAPKLILLKYRVKRTLPTSLFLVLFRMNATAIYLNTNSKSHLIHRKTFQIISLVRCFHCHEIVLENNELIANVQKFVTFTSSSTSSRKTIVGVIEIWTTFGQ